MYQIFPNTKFQLSFPTNFSELKELTSKTIDKVIDIAKFAFKWTIGLPLTVWNYVTSKPIDPSQVTDLTGVVNDQPSDTPVLQKEKEKDVVTNETAPSSEQATPFVMVEEKKEIPLEKGDSTPLATEEKSENSLSASPQDALQKLYQRGLEIRTCVNNRCLNMVNSAKATASRFRETIFGKLESKVNDDQKIPGTEVKTPQAKDSTPTEKGES